MLLGKVFVLLIFRPVSVVQVVSLVAVSVVVLILVPGILSVEVQVALIRASSGAMSTILKYAMNR